MPVEPFPYKFERPHVYAGSVCVQFDERRRAFSGCAEGRTIPPRQPPSGAALAATMAKLTVAGTTPQQEAASLTTVSVCLLLVISFGYGLSAPGPPERRLSSSRSRGLRCFPSTVRWRPTALKAARRHRMSA
ncbi:hypothetical protein GQ53DRAFT_132984 [Thozetella sp. PMI_491]|nr:hypothetical protein GQ53DRAFT_132984 [Thozetella sp. PMI_491]